VALLTAATPAQRFAWLSGQLAERLIEQEGIDLIEAQEWEAPLYYFLLRRRLGLGPRRQPPCVVHFHSPSELIYHHNEWTGRPEYLTARRMEEFCIRSADSWLCPSRYLARQAAERYRIPLEAIAVIPYPIGDSTPVSRPDDVWTEGTILYVGRLEPRKGVIEFVDAAVEVAREQDGVRFVFIGDDVRYPKTVTVRRYLESRIPGHLRRRFRFHGVTSRPRLAEFRAGARLAVVPSRWENFPYSCLEAMASGLPVMVSPTGGMAEMVEEGVTGWVAESQSPTDLAATLRQALAVLGRWGASMSRAAAESIRRSCGNETTTRRHVARRNELVRQFGHRVPSEAVFPGGLGVIIQAESNRSAAAVESIGRLATPPCLVEEIGTEGGSGELARALRMMTHDRGVGAVALVPASVALEAHFPDACAGALARAPDLGLISGWVDRGDGGFASPTPAFPYQWLNDGVGDAAVIRTEALLDAGELPPDLPIDLARWHLWNAILVAGWQASAYPAVLAIRDRSWTAAPRAAPPPSWRQALRARFPAAFARDAGAVDALERLPVSDREPRLREALRLPLRQQLELALEALRRPREALRWLGDRLSRAGR
jgi:glycosyltransferase involved in cell wall biosynthesis